MSRDQNGRFQTGGKPGPGRPLGSRNKLAENFLADLCTDWTKHGAAVISKVRNKNPSVYLRILASIVPRDLPEPTRNNEFDSLSNEELGAELIEAAGTVMGEDKLQQYLREKLTGLG
jgi:hypothetical protein